MSKANDLGHSEFLDRAMEESVALLAGVAFNSRRGAYRQGELAAVSVLVSAEGDTGTVRLRVMCHDPGHLGIDWDGLPLILVDRESGDERIGFLNARGRSEFRVDIAADHDLGLESFPRKVVAKVEIPESMLTGECASDDTEPEWRVEGKSLDGSVWALAETVGIGEFRISVGVNAPEMLNSAVRLVLRSELNPSDVWLDKKVELDIDNGSKGSWTGQIGENELRDRSANAILLVFPCKRT